MNKLIEILSNNFIGLLIGTLLGGEITRFLYRPQVLIQLRDVTPLYSDKGFFLSIHIANRGRVVASDCIGNITLNLDTETVMNPEDYLLDRFEESLPKYTIEEIKLEHPRHQLTSKDKVRKIQNSSLCWSQLGNPYKIDINPGSTQSLDICRVQLYDDTEKKERFWYLIFPCEQGWRKVRCRVKLNPGEPLEGKLLICPSNVFPTVRKISFMLKETESTPKFTLEEYSFLKRLYFAFHRSQLFFD